MYQDRSICVVIPAFDEAPRIRRTIETLPGFVDRVVVVDDGSSDDTVSVAGAVGDPRVEIVSHPSNQGVGRAVATGYRHALRCGFDVTVVIAGDGQMNPANMEPLVHAVIDGRADYAKGNRLLRLEGWVLMPIERLAGGVALSLLTMLATGYFHVFDTQCGYTAIGRRALSRLPLDELYPRYGYPNDLLAYLARDRARIVDVPVRISYGPGTSKMRLHRVVLPLLGVLWRGMARRWAVARA